MAKNKMPPELLAHFKSKNEGKDSKEESKIDDKTKRKEALSKARTRLEKKKDEDKK